MAADKEQVKETSPHPAINAIRIIVMGASSVGKISLIRQFVYGCTDIPPEEKTADFFLHEIEDDGATVKLDVLESSGDLLYPKTLELSITTGDIFILVYDINDRASFDKVREIRKIILKEKIKAKKVSIMIVGNKNDLENNSRALPRDFAETVVSCDWGHCYQDISACDKEAVDNAFIEIIQRHRDTDGGSSALGRRRMQRDVDDLRRLGLNTSSKNSDDLELNIVLKNVLESSNECVVSKVNGVIRDGLRLRDVQVVQAQRRASRNSRYPGVIIAKCESIEDRKNILFAKSRLKESRNFEDVYIHSDKPIQQRILDNNMKLLVDTVGRGKLTMTGNRLQRVERNRDMSFDHADERSNRRDKSPTRRNSNHFSEHHRSQHRVNSDRRARGYVDKHGSRDVTRPMSEQVDLTPSNERWQQRTNRRNFYIGTVRVLECLRLLFGFFIRK